MTVAQPVTMSDDGRSWLDGAAWKPVAPDWSGPLVAGPDYVIGLSPGWVAEDSVNVTTRAGLVADMWLKSRAAKHGYHPTLMAYRRFIGKHTDLDQHLLDAASGSGFAEGPTNVDIDGVTSRYADLFPSNLRSTTAQTRIYAAVREDILYRFQFTVAAQDFAEWPASFAWIMGSLRWTKPPLRPRPVTLNGPDYSIELPAGWIVGNAQGAEMTAAGFATKGATSTFFVLREDRPYTLAEAVTRAAVAENAEVVAEPVEQDIGGVEGMRFVLSKPGTTFFVFCALRGSVMHRFVVLGHEDLASENEHFLSDVLRSLRWTASAVPIGVQARPQLPAHQQQVQVKTYRTDRQFELDATRMMAAGWQIQGQSTNAQKTAAMRTLGKFALTGGAGLLLTGRSKKGGEIVVTWTR